MNTIRLLRQQAGITQQELAVTAGTSQSTIAAYETGTKSPTLRTIEHLAGSIGMEMIATFVPAMTREDRRSLAFHGDIVDILRKSPDRVLGLARRNLAKLLRIQPGARALFARWQSWLDLPLEDLIANVLDPSPLAREMRQVSPFSGVLSAADRARILTQFRKVENA